MSTGPPTAGNHPSVPDVSVIIVNWNGRAMLERCIESILGHPTRPTLEIIVVDNGSEDDSAAAVRSRFPGVRLIENGVNAGFAKGNNIGIEASAGRYVCLANSDILVREGSIDRLYDFIESNPGAGIVGPRVLFPDGSLQDSCRRFPTLWSELVLASGIPMFFPKASWLRLEHMTDFDHRSDREVDYLAGCFLLARRSAVERVGLLDERFFIYQEEVDWCFRFRQAGWKILFTPSAEVIHHHAASSSKDPVRFSVEQQKALRKYWNKYFGVLSNRAHDAILLWNHFSRYLLRSIYRLFAGRGEPIDFHISKHLACIKEILGSSPMRGAD